MTQEEFSQMNWHRGNLVQLKNGKEYFLKGIKGHGKYLLLYSEEYNASFVADYRIVSCRTSDYEEPEEVYLEMKRLKQEAHLERMKAERLARQQAKEERRRRAFEAQERQHQAALARKEARRKLQQEKEAAKALQANPSAQAKQQTPNPQPVVTTAKTPAPTTTTTDAPTPQPKRKRMRITVNRVEKVQFK